MESSKHVKFKNENDLNKYQTTQKFRKWRKLKQSLSLDHKKDSKSHGNTSMWKKLKQAILKRKGLIEVGPQHAKYEFTRKFLVDYPFLRSSSSRNNNETASGSFTRE